MAGRGLLTPPAYYADVLAGAAETWEKFQDPDVWRSIETLFRQVRSADHVVSELLQNADDAGATWAHVRLEDTELVVEHNGADFTAEQFRALCRFAQSTKTELRTTGFRGIGFKSTFAFGPEVQLLTPSLAVRFMRDAFLLPEWMEGGEQRDTVLVRVAIESDELLESARAQLRRWASNPTPVALFRSLRRLTVDGHTIAVVGQEPGPVPGSIRMTLRTDDHAATLLRITSAPMPLPLEAREELRKERHLDGEEDVTSSVDILMGDPSGSRVYVILPTTTELGLQFSVNAPFVQDPARNRIEDPARSPTNAWLLDRVAELAAESLAAWAGDHELDLAGRAEAYALAVPAGTASGPLVDRLASRFHELVADRSWVLTAAGELDSPDTVVAVPTPFGDVWDASTVLQLFAPKARGLLAREISGPHQRALTTHGVGALGRDEAVRRLEHGGIPQPEGHEATVNLWNAVQSVTARQPWSWRLRDLHLVPTEGGALLHPASECVAPLAVDVALDQVDRESLAGLVPIVERSFWVHVRAGIEPNADVTPAVRSAASLLATLRLSEHPTFNAMLQRAAERVFGSGSTVEQRFALGCICIRAMQAPRGLQLRTQAGSWRRLSELVTDSERLAGVFPASFWRDHVPDSAYATEVGQAAWARWAGLLLPGLVPPPTRTTNRLLHSRADVAAFALARGGRTPNEYRLRSDRFVTIDHDYPKDVWDAWHSATPAGEHFWCELAEGLAPSFQTLHQAGLDAAQVEQHGTSNEYTVQTGPLRSAWLDKLRGLPCVRDQHGRPRLPGELLRATAETHLLGLDVSFVAPAWDKPENAAFLDALGVQSRLDDVRPMLKRLREWSRIPNPPVAQLASVFRALGAVYDALSAEQREILRSSAREEPLLFSEDGTWQRADMLCQSNVGDLPGALILHPDLRAAAPDLWDRLDVQREPSPDMLRVWLADLSSGTTLGSATVAALMRAMGRNPGLAADARGWVSLASTWESLETFTSAARQRIGRVNLHPRFKQRTADVSGFPPEWVGPEGLQGLPTLHIEWRVDGTSTGREGDLPPWLTKLFDTLTRVTEPSEAPESLEADRFRALELLEGRWVAHDKPISVAPHVGEEQAGPNQERRAVVAGETIFVAGRSHQYFDELAVELAGQFGEPEIRAAVGACVERSPEWVEAYLFDRFELTSAPLPTPVPSAGPASQVFDHGHDRIGEVDVRDLLASVGEDPAVSTRPSFRSATAAHEGQQPTWRSEGPGDVGTPSTGSPRDTPVAEDRPTMTSDGHEGEREDPRPGLHEIRDDGGHLRGYVWVAPAPLDRGFEMSYEDFGRLQEYREVSVIWCPTNDRTTFDRYRFDEFMNVAQAHPAQYRFTARQP